MFVTQNFWLFVKCFSYWYFSDFSPCNVSLHLSCIDTLLGEATLPFGFVTLSSFGGLLPKDSFF